MFLLTCLFAVCLLCHSAVQAQANNTWTIGQDVITTSGIVSGHATPEYPEVSEYLGIPFGQSTGGSARWLPPTRYGGTGSIDGSSFGPACPQSLGSGLGGSVNQNQSEDCLSLNVWTTPQHGEAKKAVMVWVYGGAFKIGDSSSTTYYGAVLANNTDVVVVNFNYRVDVFGFPGAPGLDQQNPGLLDQRLAVEWVRDNIAAFGGDPERITLFGESAGGYSVDFYAYAWTDDPIVNGLIAESGNALRKGGHGVGLSHELNGFQAWYNLSSQLGCGGEEVGAATVDCARGKMPDEILTVVNNVSSGGLLSPSFAPWIDDKTVFTDVQARARNGQFIRKPLLIGSNYNESILFATIANLSGTPLPPEQTQSLDNEFRCGARDASIARGKKCVPTWRYIFANNDPITNIGGTHGDDVFQVFGDGMGLSGIFQTAWSEFAKDPVSGLVNYGWPKYNDDGATLVLIAPNKKVSAEFAAPELYDQACPPSAI